MTEQMTEAALWCLVVGMVVVLILLARQRRITTTTRRQKALLEGSLRAREEEVRHLVTVRIPALAESLHQHLPVPGLRDEQLAGTEFARNLHKVLDLFAGAVDKARVKADQSAKAALKSSMRALQGLANEQQLAISDMQERHDHPDVLRDLLEIDHTNSQFGRRAQAIAVLCGSWPGRQRASSQLVDVVRGAKSRVRDYRRVEVHSQVDVAVISRSVEPVVLAVAELMDNAARHSQPNTAVEVNLRPAHNGACVVIDDAGVGMDAEEIQQAGMLLSGRQTVDVTRLGDPPQFGFAVIGVLAARYGFNVSVDTRSPYGGVRAVLFLPSALLTHPDSVETTAAAAAAPAAPAAPPAPAPTPAAPAPAPRHAAPPPAPIITPAAPPAPAPAPAAPEPELPAFTPPPDFTPEELPSGNDLPTRRSKVNGHRRPDRPESAESAEAPSETEEPPVPSATANGLPKRRRRSPVAANQNQEQRVAAEQTATPDPTTERSARETAQRMGAFARGTRSGRACSPEDAAAPQQEGNPHP